MPQRPHTPRTPGAKLCRVHIRKPGRLAAVIAVSVAGCGQTPRSAAPPPAEVKAAFAGSPAPLAALHAEASQAAVGEHGAVQGGPDRAPWLSDGRQPVGSWCEPCRIEFPIFQRAAVALGRRVAFVGLDVNDPPGDARTFLRQFPITYPSCEDPGAHTAFALKAGAFSPTTEFYDRTGKLAYTHASHASRPILHPRTARVGRPHLRGSVGPNRGRTRFGRQHRSGCAAA